MGIELGTIDADELGLAVHGDAARAAHTRSIYHDGVEAGFGGDIVFPGRERDELHHDRRTDGDTLIHFLTLDNLLHAEGNDAFLSHRTVVRHQDHLVRPLCQFLFEDDQALGTGSEDSDNAVTGFLEGFDDGQHRRSTHSTARTNDRAVLLYTRCLTERTYHVMDHVARVEG